MIWGEEVKLVSVATTNAVKNTTGNTRAYSMNFIQIRLTLMSYCRWYVEP